MSIGALSNNAAASALLASHVPALGSRMGAAGTDSVDATSPSSRAGRHDRTFQRYRTSGEPGREDTSQRARHAGGEGPAHLTALSPRTSDASASTLFVTQLLSQDTPRTPSPGLPAIDHAMDGHRDGPELGSQQYRMAGGEPKILGSQATLLSISV
jgi:hypothetical protein